MKPTPFSHTDYKAYLRSVIANSDQTWGQVSKLADAAGCQRSYFSRAINAEVHLTPDHAYGLSEYLGLNEQETEYFLLLLEQDRASTARYRKRIKAKMHELKQRHEDLRNKVNRPIASFEEREFHYYSNWIYSAIHIGVSIPKLQTANALAEHLQIPLAMVEHTLKQLETWNLVKQEKGKWKFAGAELHVSKDSPLVAFHHMNWRQRATFDAQVRKPESLHFTVVQSIDRAAYEKIKQKLLQMIDEASAIAGPAKEEILICFNADFFET